MKDRKILSCLLAGLILTALIFSGCTKTAPDPTIPTETTVPSQPPEPAGPETVTAGYFTGLNVDFYGFFVTQVAVTYGDGTITTTHTSDGATYSKTYDHYGRLLRQIIDGPDDFHSEEVNTYLPQPVGNNNCLVSSVYTQGDYRTELVQTFNAQGKLLTEDYSNTDGYTYRDTHAYDEQGRRIETVNTNSEGKNNKTVFVYDEAGRMIQEDLYKSGALKRRVTRTYDEKGLLLKEVTNASTEDSTVTFTYDEKGNLLKEYQKTGKKSWIKNTYTYNEANQPLSHVYEGYKQTKSTEEYTYNDQGLLSGTKLTCGKSVYTEAHTYDAAGRLTETVAVSGKDTTRTAWVYDAAGNLLKQTVTEPDSTTATDAYTYDANGHLLTYTHTNGQGEVTSSCDYTYGYIQLLPEEADRLKTLMGTLFVEFLP